VPPSRRTEPLRHPQNTSSERVAISLERRALSRGSTGTLRRSRVACKLVRGFALTDRDALALLAEWNQRCRPSWSEYESRTKLAAAHKY
jgi:hypothetical protein